MSCQGSLSFSTTGQDIDLQGVFSAHFSFGTGADSLRSSCRFAGTGCLVARQETFVEPLDAERKEVRLQNNGQVVEEIFGKVRNELRLKVADWHEIEFKVARPQKGGAYPRATVDCSRARN